MSKVAVNEEILIWALDRSGISHADIERKFPKISLWMKGEDQPTLRQLESFADATLTPFGFLFLKSPPEEKLPIAHFRTAKDARIKKTSPELLETVQAMERRQEWLKELFINEHYLEIDFVGSCKISDAPETVAKKIRRALGFEDLWASGHSTWTNALVALRGAMESVGIFVVVNGVLGNNTHRKLNPEEFRGFVLSDKYAPLVFVNGADSKSAQMFTLAHELAHLFIGQSAAFDLRNTFAADDPTEKACNRIAAEFLVPGDHLMRLWPSVKDLGNPYEAIARRFKVSQIVAARRVLDLNLIKKSEFLEFYQSYIENENREKATPAGEGGGDFYNNQNTRVGKRFALTVWHAARDGRLLFSDAYRLTGLKANTFEKYIAHIKD